MKKILLTLAIATTLFGCTKVPSNTIKPWGTQPNQFVCKCINLQVHDTSSVDMVVVNQPDTAASRAYAVRLCDSLNSSVTSCSIQ